MEAILIRSNAISRCAKPAQDCFAGVQATGPMWRSLINMASRLDQLYKDVALHCYASTTLRFIKDMTLARETYSELLIDVKSIATSVAQFSQWEYVALNSTLTWPTGSDSPKTKLKKFTMAAGTSAFRLATSTNWTCQLTNTRPSWCSQPSNWWICSTLKCPGICATHESSFWFIKNSYILWKSISFY